MYRQLLLLVSIIPLIGCNSIRTTFLQVNECGQVCPIPGDCKNGVPTLVKVPTHITVEILQTDIWYQQIRGNDPIKMIHVPESTCRNATASIFYTEQMFLINPKRPLAGVGGFGIKYREEDKDGVKSATGAMEKLTYEADDQTLAKVGGLVNNILAQTLKSSSNTGANTGFEDDANSKVIASTHSIAVRCFPIRDGVEQEIDAFVSLYINGCNNQACTSAPSYATSN